MSLRWMRERELSDRSPIRESAEPRDGEDPAREPLSDEASHWDGPLEAIFGRAREARERQAAAAAEAEAPAQDAGDVSSGEGPPVPETVEDTGLAPRFLLNFLLRAVYVFGIETVEQAEQQTKLSQGILEPIFEMAKQKRLVEILGLSSERVPQYRYALTSEGRLWAQNAMEESLYTGPAPVPLRDYRAQVVKQSVANERVDQETLVSSLSHLVLPEGMICRIGPALNSGKALLLYGAPGNGKTSVADAIARCFQQTIFVPHCIEVDGQIVKIFDAAIHEVCDEGESSGYDPRWLRCRRPAVLTGGELTIEMLDLSFDSVSKFYEAPAHIKATGGVFIIDDFGRQRVRPRDLLNRWILPLERKIDFLTLHTGKKLRMPFDQLVVFSTNFPPHEIMDDAALRRIEYKIHIPSPQPDDYKAILRRLCEQHELELSDEVLSYVLEQFYPEAGIPLSGSHPRFLIEHVLARCAFEDVPPELSLTRVRDALQNLVVDEAAPRPVGGETGRFR